jgi:hypothetical protein
VTHGPSRSPRCRRSAYARTTPLDEATTTGAIGGHEGGPEVRYGRRWEAIGPPL